MNRTIIGISIAALGAVVIAPTIAAGHQKQVGTIIIQKHVIGKPGLFGFYVNDQLIGTGGDGATFTYTKDEHGRDVGNTVSEQPAASNTQTYTSRVVCTSDLEGVVATNNGTSTKPGDVSLKNGETVTCVFTNTDSSPPPPRDLCKNLPGTQKVVPPGFLRAGVNCYKVAPPPQRHHHKKAQPKVSQPGAVVKAPPTVSVTVQQIADSGAGGG